MSLDVKNSSYNFEKSGERQQSTNFTYDESETTINNSTLNKALKGILLQRVVGVSEFRVKFRFGAFIKFIFYHLLFFYFSLAANIPIALLDSWQGVENMAFWYNSKNKVFFISQMNQWVCTFMIMLLWLQKWY